ncbi:MAG: hypothetical protein GXP42_03720 [Chloroflexi bacterium]|nr:hypothetical protein [Chloroflexota bacterium]
MKHRRNVAFVWLALLFVAAIGRIDAAQALEIRGGGDVVIGAGEVFADDLYAAGKTVIVDGVIANY